jgi:hypothetical protein
MMTAVARQELTEQETCLVQSTERAFRAFRDIAIACSEDDSLVGIAYWEFLPPTDKRPMIACKLDGELYNGMKLTIDQVKQALIPVNLEQLLLISSCTISEIRRGVEYVFNLMKNEVVCLINEIRLEFNDAI